MPTPILSGGARSPLGVAPLFADEGGRKTRKTRPLRTGRLTPRLGGCFPLVDKKNSYPPTIRKRTDLHLFHHGDSLGSYQSEEQGDC
jgi:hypothetical protein